jgi:hypothetical protein
MNNIIAKCNICSSFMPEQEEDRRLSWIYGSGPIAETKLAPVLFIDNCDDKRDISRALLVATDLVRDSNFVYTTTIRCDFMPGEIEIKQLIQAEHRCAVWTHSLLENRLLIISTQAGLRQMQLGEDKSPGDIWQNSRVGVVLCVPPLLRIPPSAIATYQSKIERVIKRRELA